MGVDAYQLAEQAAKFVIDNSPVDAIDLAMVLGSGWSGATTELGAELATIPVGDIPGFRAPTVAGHGGSLVLVKLATGKVAGVLTGRTHFYESRDAVAVAHPIRTLAKLGAKTILLTNGCGGLNPDWLPGTVVAIRDHINLTGDTPLRGPKFIDMSTTWTPRLIELVQELDSTIQTGVYAQFAGPQYETPAEVRYAATIGADLVGMSTGLEAIAAREAGLDILGLSLVTNAAAGISDTKLDHQEVIAAGAQSANRLAKLVSQIASKL